jgi:UDP-N-acetylglucosamine 4,6-dehydratase
VNDRVTLVTGGTGWLGSRLVHALLLQGHRVRVYARSDKGARQLDNALGALAGSVDFRLGDIADRSSIRDALDGAGIVFHLAAEKAVDRCEREPAAAVRTNVLGTLTLLELAKDVGVSHIVAASTDKAAEPVGVLGTTKHLMERLLTSNSAPPRSTAVRLGGLLQSTGSVLDRWRRTARGGYIEVTDPEMTRFAMTSNEAIALLIGGASLAGGEVIARALSAYRLGDLAEVFAAAHGTRVEVVGPRLGERTHEVLISDADAPYSRREADLFVITPGRRQAGIPRYSSDRAPRLAKAQLAVEVGKA